jgi:hypothetical protein
MTHDPISERDDAPPPEPATQPVQPMTTPGPSRLRVGLVSGAALALAVGVVATSFAATPANPAASTAGTGTVDLATTTAWLAPAAVSGGIDGGSGTFDHGRFGGQGGFRDITISAISGSSLSLATSDGWTRTVAVTDDMSLTKGGQAIELSDLAVGDEIRLLQERADDGTVTVTGIVVVVPSVVGEVSALTATSFKVTGRDGAVWTITLTGDTVYRYGATDGTLADIANGDGVLVLGTSTGDNALTATSVAVRGDRAMGTVTATTASSITIEARDGTSVTIHVDGDTVYRVAGDTAGTLADIAVDDVIVAVGRERSDGSIDAAVVMDGVRGNGPGLGGGRGGHGGPGFGPGWIDDGETDDSSTDAG